MSSETVYICTIAISAIILASYFWRWRTKSDLADGMVIVLSSSGIVTGIQIGCVTFSNLNLGALAEYKLYLTLGGFALIWISIQTIYGCFKDEQ